MHGSLPFATSLDNSSNNDHHNYCYSEQSLSLFNSHIEALKLAEEDEEDPEIVELEGQYHNNNNNNNNKDFFHIHINIQLDRSTILRIVLLLVLISATLLLFGFLLGSDEVQDKLLDFFHWLQKIPEWMSVIVIVMVYCCGLLFCMPGTPFNLAAGFLYGPYLGSTVSMFGCVSGAFGAFLLGRTIAREWIQSVVSGRPKFKVVDWAIQKNGTYIIFLTRLSPLFPFPILNYAFRITKVRVWQYLLGTTLGVFPATIVYTYLGSLMRSLTQIWNSKHWNKEESLSNILWIILGIAVSILSIVIISVITKRAIASATKEYQLLQSPDLEEICSDDEQMVSDKKIEVNEGDAQTDALLLKDSELSRKL